MKIKFYQLPKAERQRILSNITKLKKERDKAQEMFDSAQKSLDEAKFRLDTNNHCLRILNEKYDFN